MAKILSVQIVDKVATYLNRQGDIVCGNNDYRIRFTFDEAWDGYDQKTARFLWNGKYIDVDFTGDEVDVPIITGTTELKVGVYTEAAGPRTSTSARIGCKRSIICEGGAPSAENDRHFANEAKAAAAQALEAAAEAQTTLEECQELLDGPGAELVQGFEQIHQDVETLYQALEQTGLIYDSEVTDTFSDRTTAGGLTIVDGTVTSVKKVQGTTTWVRSKNLVDLSIADGVTVGGITCTAENNTLTFRGTTEGEVDEYGQQAGELLAIPLSQLGLEAGKTYTLSQSEDFSSANFSIFLAFKGVTELGSHTVTIETEDIEYDEKLYLVWVNYTPQPPQTVDYTISFMINEGDTALPYEPYFAGFVNSTFSGILSQSADGTKTDGLTIGQPVELGQFDTLDPEAKTVTRKTLLLDCTKDSFSLGSSTGTAGVTQFWVSFTKAPKVYDKQYSQKDIIPNHTYTVGQNSSSKWVFFGRTSQDNLAIFLRNDDVLVYNGATLDRNETNKAMRAHLINTGFQFVCSPSDVISTETLTLSESTYRAYNGGTETVVPAGQTVTTTQNYYEITGGAN